MGSQALPSQLTSQEAVLAQDTGHVWEGVGKKADESRSEY